MRGYNTLVEALSLEKPVLAFPGSDAGDQTFQVNALHSQGVLLKGDQTQSELEITALMNQLLRFRRNIRSTVMVPIVPSRSSSSCC
jgi:UDP:flavonoid glycosyltransferase YjiC (YdhE family)